MRCNFTDMGNAERFICDHKSEVRFSPESATWLTWQGDRWVTDNGEFIIMAKGKETIKKIPEEIQIDPTRKSEILEHAQKSQTLGKIQAMIKLAKSDASIHVAIKDLDSDIWSLNCTNGTIDLKTGELRSHKREDLITKSTGTKFDPEAQSPVWDNFINQVMAGNVERTSFLQRAVGYSLTGSTVEQCMFILEGFGSNGKTSFVEAIRRSLGQYAKNTSTSTLLKNNHSIRNDLARLKDARFVSASEITAGKHLDEAMAKQLTGADPVTSRYLYKEYFEYSPQFKLFLIVNHKPEIRGTDYGIWRRIMIVNFPVRFEEDAVDKYLAEKLEAESPGILAWAVRGCLEWQKKGLAPPASIKSLTKEYREETDILPQFIADRCEHDKSARISIRELYDTFSDWALNNCDEVIKKKSFGVLMKSAGFKSSKSNDVRYWQGLRLKKNIVEATATIAGTGATENENSVNTEIAEALH